MIPGTLAAATAAIYLLAQSDRIDPAPESMPSGAELALAPSITRPETLESALQRI
jgi:hypothetical protein